MAPVQQEEQRQQQPIAQQQEAKMHSSRIICNVIAVFINFLTDGAYAYFLHKEKEKSLAATGVEI